MKFNLITDELIHLSLSLAVGGFFITETEIGV